MKEVYRFTINKKETVDEVEKSTNEKGEEVSVTKKVTKEIPYTYVIKRPTRAQNDDGEIFRASTESDLIRRGVISATLLQKRLIDDGGILSQEEKKEREELGEKFLSKQSEYTKLTEVKEEDRDEDQKKSLETLVKELGDIINRINELDNASSSLYNRTAEALARNKTILYFTLVLSYKEKDGKLLPVFGEGDYDKKLKNYDIMEEAENDFDYKLIQKLLFCTGLWFMGRATTKEEFDNLMTIYENQNLLGNL